MRNHFIIIILIIFEINLSFNYFIFKNIFFYELKNEESMVNEKNIFVEKNMINENEENLLIFYNLLNLYGMKKTYYPQKQTI